MEPIKISEELKSYYTEEEVINIAKEAVGLWRHSCDKRLYLSKKYFGRWIKEKLKKL